MRNSKKRLTLLMGLLRVLIVDGTDAKLRVYFCYRLKVDFPKKVFSTLEILPFLCTAVHVILSFLVSFSLLFLLYLFLDMPSCIGDVNKYIERDSSGQRIFISDRRVSPPLRCPEEALTQPLSALSAASYNTCPSV